MWTIQVSSEAIEVLLLSQHNRAVFWFVCDIRHWKLENEVKSSSGHENCRTVLCSSLV